ARGRPPRGGRPRRTVPHPGHAPGRASHVVINRTGDDMSPDGPEDADRTAPCGTKRGADMARVRVVDVTRRYRRRQPVGALVDTVGSTGTHVDADARIEGAAPS